MFDGTMPFDYKLILALIFVALLIIGFIKIRLNINELKERQKFLFKYQNKFVEYLENQSEKDMNWLIENMDEAQRRLGRAGIIDNYRGPYNSFTATNYHMLVNVVSKLSTPNSLHDAEIRHALDTFPRAKGLIDSFIKERNKDLVNPFKWLTNGVKVILQTPFYILGELGIISPNAYVGITNNGVFKFIAGVISFIGILETIAAFVTNKSVLVSLIENIIK